MRYEQQVVLQMPPGSPSSNAPAVDSNAGKTAEESTAKPTDKVAAKPAAKAPTAAHNTVTKQVAKPAHVTAQSERSFAVPAKKTAPAPKAKAHAAPPKHNPVVTKHPAGTTQSHPTQVVHP
jgi:hypothetical protein